MLKFRFSNRNKTDAFDLDKKEDIDREFFTNYDHIMHAREEKENKYDYEDEYDDTYDENTVANDDFIASDFKIK